MSRAVLCRFQRFMDRTDHSLADVFAPNEAPAPDISPAETAVAPHSMEPPAHSPSAQPSPGLLSPTRPSSVRAASVYPLPTGPSAAPASSAQAPPVRPSPLTAPDVEARIRAAYRELAAEPGAWVSLTRLRPLLGDVHEADVDEPSSGWIACRT